MNVTIRPLTDIDRLMSWRREVIGEVFGVRATPLLLAANRAYYAAHIADGTHIAVVAEADGAEAGCGAICLTDELPSPDNPTGRCAYLMNIYVRPPFRRAGIGHAVVVWLVQKALGAGCGKIYLETTDAARPLYKEIGFEEMHGMMKYAEHNDR